MELAFVLATQRVLLKSADTEVIAFPIHGNRGNDSLVRLLACVQAQKKSKLLCKEMFNKFLSVRGGKKR